MKYKFYMIDLDATMYWGTKIIPGAKEFIDYLINNDIGFIFSEPVQENATYP